MPVPNYGVLKGHPIARQVRGPHGKPPHLHISLVAGDVQFDVAVNILSKDGSEVLYYVNHAFAPPRADDLLALPEGRTLLERGNPLALDFVRQGIVNRDEMASLRARDAMRLTASDLHNEIDDMVVRGIHDPSAQFFAFGSNFGEGHVGIDDIHMNQGNPPGEFFRDNGTFQDGAMFAYFPASDRWLAAFIAFQSQIWDTDDDGNPH